MGNNKQIADMILDFVKEKHKTIPYYIYDITPQEILDKENEALEKDDLAMAYEYRFSGKYHCGRCKKDFIGETGMTVDTCPNCGLHSRII